jgi:hypothetical protein
MCRASRIKQMLFGTAIAVGFEVCHFAIMKKGNPGTTPRGLPPSTY